MEEQKYTEEDYKKVILEQKKQIEFLENRIKLLDAVTIRLNFLFKVIEFNAAFDDEFYERCAQEIENLLTLPEKEPEEVTE